MSRRVVVSETCRAKRRYSDELSARAGALLCLEEIGNTSRLFIYRCQECYGWHLTKMYSGNKMKVTLGEPVAERSVK